MLTYHKKWLRTLCRCTRILGEGPTLILSERFAVKAIQLEDCSREKKNIIIYSSFTYVLFNQLCQILRKDPQELLIKDPGSSF